MPRRENIAGAQPWLPWPLKTQGWWTEAVRAERLAALRIGVGLVMLLDVLGAYWPHLGDYFGPGSLGSADLFAGRRALPHWNWSLLGSLQDPAAFRWVFGVWAVAALALVFGIRPKLAAAVAWVIAVSVINLDYYIHNAGDRIRIISLMYLALSPCGAVWSLETWWRKRGVRFTLPVYISPWALRLLFVQLGAIYFFSGIFKLRGDLWHSGQSMHYVLGDLAWTRWSFAEFPLPYAMTQAMTWITVAWELGFPLLVWYRPTRTLTLVIGAGFHLATGVMLDLGLFPLYILCWYLPLLPWERWFGREEPVDEGLVPVLL